MPMMPHAPAGRIHDHIRHPPAKLLGDLQAHGLLALDPVGLPERGHVLIARAPVEDIGDYPACVPDVTVDEVQLGAPSARGDLRGDPIPPTI
jgi:hypothetical protein